MDLQHFDIPRYLAALPLFQEMTSAELQRLATGCRLRRFSRGDTVSIYGTNGREIARGLAGYDADEARLIVGKKSADIAAILGYAGRAAMVHRDDLVVTGLPVATEAGRDMSHA